MGHDRRGNALYARDADGAEMIYPLTREVLRRRGRRQDVVTLTVRDRLLDDDLPRIATVYRRFLETGRVDE